MHFMKTYIRGVTLLELMVTVAVLGILLAVMVPSMKGMLEASGLKSNGDVFARSVAYARTEASTLHEQVVICPSTDRSTCAASGDYEIGMIIFTDKNANGSFDPGTGSCLPTEECLVRYIEPLSSGYTLRVGGVAAKRIIFNGFGEHENNSDGLFYLCAPGADKVNDQNSSYTIRISGSGSVGSTKGTLVCPP